MFSKFSLKYSSFTLILIFHVCQILVKLNMSSSMSKIIHVYMYALLVSKLLLFSFGPNDVLLHVDSFSRKSFTCGKQKGN